MMYTQCVQWNLEMLLELSIYDNRSKMSDPLTPKFSTFTGFRSNDHLWSRVLRIGPTNKDGFR